MTAQELDRMLRNIPMNNKGTQLGKIYDNPCRICGEPTGHNYFFCPRHAAMVREPYI